MRECDIPGGAVLAERGAGQQFRAEERSRRFVVHADDVGVVEQPEVVVRHTVRLQDLGGVEDVRAFAATGVLRVPPLELIPEVIAELGSGRCARGGT